MKTIFLLCTVVTCLSVRAQVVPHYKGVIVDCDQTVIQSELAVEPALDVLLYKVDSTVSLMPAHKVKSFRYFDAEKNINRQFVSLRTEGVYHFYEIVIQGDVQVLRRLKKYASGWEADEGYDYDFFIFFAGKILPLSKFKPISFSALVNVYGERLIDFVEQNRLDLSKVASVFLVVKKCNQFSFDQRAVAMR
jgi:hypothetical protein